MTIVTALRDVARGKRPLGWDAWYPIAEAAATDPQALVEAIEQFGQEEQYNLLEQLKVTPGPLSDFIVIALTEHPTVFADEQIRLFALTDSQEALERRHESLKEIARSLEQTGYRLDGRCSEVIDTAAEITSLRARRDELLARNLESGFTEMSDLEWEISRLEILRTRLESYDPESRRADRDRLVAETDTLMQKRRSVEHEVGTALDRKQAVEATLMTLEARHSQLEDEIVTVETDTAAISRKIEDAQQQIVVLERSRKEVTKRAGALEEELKRAKEALRTEERRLRELETSPLSVEARSIRTSISELFLLLPSDEVDRVFDDSRRHKP